MMIIGVFSEENNMKSDLINQEQGILALLVRSLGSELPKQIFTVCHISSNLFNTSHWNMHSWAEFLSLGSHSSKVKWGNITRDMHWVFRAYWLISSSESHQITNKCSKTFIFLSVSAGKYILQIRTVSYIQFAKRIQSKLPVVPFISQDFHCSNR